MNCAEVNNDLYLRRSMYTIKACCGVREFGSTLARAEDVHFMFYMGLPCTLIFLFGLKTFKTELNKNGFS